jgi:SAM-dependent methyltransferase
VNYVSIKTFKRAVRRMGHRLGLVTDWEQKLQALNGSGREEPAGWYDQAYSNSEEYRAHYSQSCYYFSWCVIADRLLRDGLKKVLEIGCGPGQFAAMLRDYGIGCYVGLDFSSKAIEMARQNVPELEFLVEDARTSDIYARMDYDVIVCTEVLEHIQDDLIVVSRFKPGVRCLCTVPNFPYVSHVRHFKDPAEVQQRYGRYFHQLDVRTLKGTRDPAETFFLFDGVRNNAIAG